MSKEQGIDTNRLSLVLRERALRLPERQVLISRIPSTEVEGSRFARINCDGYGLLRRSITARADWPVIDILPEVASRKLRVSKEKVEWTQIFRDAVCNYRCWYCFIDHRLLKGESGEGRFFTAEELIDLSQQEHDPARIICLSGGQPELTPEWTLWSMKALEKRGLENRLYLWQDDNLSTFFLWKYLRAEDVEYMKQFKNYGRAACLKGFSPRNFYENTGAHQSFFEQQIGILKHLVNDGFDVYVYLPLLTDDMVMAATEIPIFMDTLRQRVHSNMPLRVFPSKVVEYPPTIKRLNPKREKMFANQGTLLSIWNEEIEKRYSPEEINKNKCDISIRGE